MKYSLAVPALVVLLAATTTSAQNWSAGSDSRAAEAMLGSPIRLGSSDMVLALLEKRVESVDWDEAPFEEVLDWARDQADGKVNIVPRWNALAIEDVDPDKTVTLRLKNVTLGSVLDEVLAQLTESGEVTYHGSGNVLRISSKQDFNRTLELRVYDVTDILFRVPDFSESAPQVDLNRRSNTGGGGGGGGQPIFANAGSQNQEELSEEGEQDPEEILEDLVEIIRETVSPDTWFENNGRGRIRGYGKRTLIVLNTIEVHEQIAGFFAKSR